MNYKDMGFRLALTLLIVTLALGGLYLSGDNSNTKTDASQQTTPIAPIQDEGLKGFKIP